MPRKYAKKKRAPRRRKARARRVPRNLGTISGIPKQRTIRMRYVQEITLISAVGVMSEARFRANGMFDPDFAVGGHQPYGWDTWSTLYNHYVVSGSKLSISVVEASGTYVPTYVGVYLADDTALPFNTWTTYKEANRGTMRILPPNNVKPLACRSTYSAKRFFNIDDIKDNVTRIGAGINADPSENAIYHVWCQAQDFTSTTPALRGLVQIDYTVTFSEPKDLAAS